jgi:phage gp36-like protein
VAYTDVDAIRNRLAPEGSDLGQGSAIGGRRSAVSLSNDTLDRFIAQSGLRIDSYLAGRYATPLDDATAASTVVSYWATVLAAFLAQATFTGGTIPADDPLRIEYDAVLAELAAVRDGRQVIDAPTAPTGEGSQFGDVINPYDGALFTSQDVFGAGQWPGYPNAEDWGGGGVVVW